MTTDPANDQQLQSFVEFACELADVAATITLPRFRQPLPVENKSGNVGFDPVTIADLSLIHIPSPRDS